MSSESIGPTHYSTDNSKLLPHESGRVPITRQAALCVQEDVQDRPAVVLRKMCEFRILVPSDKYVVKAIVDAVSGNRGHRIEDVAIDHVRQGITKETRLQIEIA